MSRMTTPPPSVTPQLQAHHPPKTEGRMENKEITISHSSESLLSPDWTTITSSLSVVPFWVLFLPWIWLTSRQSPSLLLLHHPPPHKCKTLSICCSFTPMPLIRSLGRRQKNTAQLYYTAAVMPANDRWFLVSLRLLYIFAVVQIPTTTTIYIIIIKRIRDFHLSLSVLWTFLPAHFHPQQI